MPADTMYAKSEGVHIAYQVTGEGPLDLLLVPDGIIPIEAMTEEPSFARFLERLGSFSRLVRFDRRGIGLSDPVSAPPTLEQWMEDARAVLDAVGSERATLLGMAEGGFAVILFAATLPERTEALVLVNATPGIYQPPLSEEGMAGAAIARLAGSIDDAWGTDTSGVEHFAPSIAGDRQFHDWLGRALRRAASPAVARAVWDVLFASDVRPILPAVRVPTLVVHRAGNRWLTPEHGRYLARNIPGATYVELPGDDHPPWLGDADAILDEIEDFLTGTRRVREPDRVLATLLFTDIVGSTGTAAELGDRRWRDLLERFRSVVREELDRYRGRQVDIAGDGVLATFDGPARAIRCARSIARAVEPLGVEVRAGLHSGECELAGDGVVGLAVHIAARVMAEAGPGEVLVSRTVRDLVAGSGIAFAERGTHVLKGVPGEWQLYAVEG